jgi:hypothetical protein
VSPDSPFRGFGSGANCERLGSAKLRHPVQDVAGDDRFNFLWFGMTCSQPVANDRFVPEEIEKVGGSDFAKR